MCYVHSANVYWSINCAHNMLKPGSQYDTDAMSVTCIKSVMRKKSILDVKFFNNLIDWTLANAGDAKLE